MTFDATFYTLAFAAVLCVVVCISVVLRVAIVRRKNVDRKSIQITSGNNSPISSGFWNNVNARNQQ